MQRKDRLRKEHDLGQRKDGDAELAHRPSGPTPERPGPEDLSVPPVPPHQLMSGSFGAAASASRLAHRQLATRRNASA